MFIKDDQRITEECTVLGTCNEEQLSYPGMVDMSLTAGASGGRVAAAPQGQLGRPQPTGGPLPPLPQQQQPQQTWFEPARGNSNTGGTGIWAGGKSAIVWIVDLIS